MADYLRSLSPFLDRCPNCFDWLRWRLIWGVKEEWRQDPLAGYRENAKHLFGYPDSTLGEYVHDVTTFNRWLAGRHSGNDGESRKGIDAGPSLLLLGATREEVEDYVVALSSRALRATTINRRIHSLNSFYVWAVHHRLVGVSPLVGVRRLKTPRRILSGAAGSLPG